MSVLQTLRSPRLWVMNQFNSDSHRAHSTSILHCAPMLKLSLEPASVLPSSRTRCSSSAPFRLAQARASLWNKLRTSSPQWVYRLQVGPNNVTRITARVCLLVSSLGGGGAGGAEWDSDTEGEQEHGATVAPTWKLWQVWTRWVKCKPFAVTLAVSLEQGDVSQAAKVQTKRTITRPHLRHSILLLFCWNMLVVVYILWLTCFLGHVCGGCVSRHRQTFQLSPVVHTDEGSHVLSKQWNDRYQVLRAESQRFHTQRHYFSFFVKQYT